MKLADGRKSVRMICLAIPVIIAVVLSGCGKNGGTAPSGATSPPTPPPAPTGKVLSWDPPTLYTDNSILDPGTELVRLEFYVNTSGTFSATDTPRGSVPAVDPGTGLFRSSMALDNLGPFPAGHQYYIAMRVEATGGAKSGFSAPVVVSF